MTYLSGKTSIEPGKWYHVWGVYDGVTMQLWVPGGITILPNGRQLTPVGERLYTGDDLWNVVPSPDGKLLVGFCDPGIVIYGSDSTTEKNSSYRIP